MKRNASLLFGGILLVVAATMLFGKSLSSSGKIQVNKKAAAKHIITSNQALNYINSFKAVREKHSDASFDLPISETFNRDAVATLLNAPGAESVRIYLGVKPNGEVAMILRPVDANGNNINANLLEEDKVSVDGKSKRSWEAIEEGARCPESCPTEDK